MRPIGVAYAETGEAIEVKDWFSLSSVQLNIRGLEASGCECGCGGFDGELELEFSRAEAEQLRDRLSAWLERGAL